MHSLYVQRLEDLGVKKRVNKTRLKNDLLGHFPESQERQEGKSTIIVFREAMKNMLKEALKKRDFTEDALILAKAAMIVRNDILSHEGFKFTGSFQQNCRRESQACLTASQVIVYNVKNNRPRSRMQSLRMFFNGNHPCQFMLASMCIN